MADDENIDDDQAVADQTDGSSDENPVGDSSDGLEFEDIKPEKQGSPFENDEGNVHTATELEPVFDVPVTVQAVLGKSYLEVSQLLKLGPGAVVELDRKVGEAIDIYVNDRLVARGEVVLLDDNLGVTMTEIIKGDRT
jgi:flagellar motor switch protein FliN/FliY